MSYEEFGGGQKSASELEEITTDNLPSSDIEYRKEHERNIHRIYGGTRPSKDLTLAQNQYNVLARILKILVDIKEQNIDPKGIVYNYAFVMESNHPFVHIDFEETEDSEIPADIAPLNFPQQKLFDIKIVNDGPAEISFMTNLPRSVREAVTNLKAGESDRLGPFTKPIIKSLKLVNTSTTQSAAIRIRTLI
jgi:hypothetical protein